MDHTIYDWTEISDKFSEGLILGNGASVAIHPEFLYKSLYESACKNGFIDASLSKVFQYHNTTDFELILRRLWHTYHVNQALEIADERTTLAYKNLRDALIQSIQAVHIEYDSVRNSDLPAIASFLKRFKTVVSLNYDLLVYWAMMYGNEKLQYGKWFKDGFLSGTFDRDWRRFRTPHRNSGATGATLVFYPHGNLSLATGEYDAEFKISCRNHSSLLDTVINQWKSAQCVPLFVSEGLTDQKEIAVGRSTYLRTVYNEVLPELGEHIAIYGWSISDYDVHILKAMKQAEKPIQSLAISIHTATGNVQDKCARITNVVKKTFEEGKKSVRMPKIYFFASSSEDCWNNVNIEQNAVLDFSRKILAEDW
jgi:hypothetical protein